jgi:hypothetical protein
MRSDYPINTIEGDYQKVYLTKMSSNLPACIRLRHPLAVWGRHDRAQGVAGSACPLSSAQGIGFNHIRLTIAA